MCSGESQKSQEQAAGPPAEGIPEFGDRLHPREHRVRPSLALALVLALVGLAYSSALGGGFVWDDHLLIDEQPFTHEIRPLGDYFGRQFWSDPTNPETRAFYRPLISLSYALEWQLWDGDAGGFHLTNLLMHLGCCALVFALARRAGAPVAAAALGAALFGTFPRLAESVAWISGRTDVAAGLGVLGALLLHRSAPGDATRRWAAGVALFLGLLCKEVAFAGVLAIAALELARRRQLRARKVPAPASPGDPVPPWRQTAGNLAPALLAALGYALLRAQATAPEVPGATPLPFDPLRNLVWFPLQALGHYALMLLRPLSPQTQIGSLGIPEAVPIAVGAGAAAALLALAPWVWRRRSPFGCALAALGVGALVPVLHVIPLAATVVAADRYLYLPVAALAVGGAAAVRSLPRPAERPALALAVVVVAAFAVTAHGRARSWGDDLLLWSDAVAHAPAGNPVPHEHLGDVLAWRGRPQEALAHYREARRIRAAHPFQDGAEPRRLANLGLVLSELGRYDEARRVLSQVVSRSPQVPAYWLQLGAVQARMLDFDAAESSLERALGMTPEFPLAQGLLGQVRRARALWHDLPPEAEKETLEIRARRATVYTLVGRMSDADRLWATIAEDPEVPAPLLHRAAVHLATRGFDRAAAERVLRRLAAAGGGREVARLARALEERKLLDRPKPPAAGG